MPRKRIDRTRVNTFKITGGHKYLRRLFGPFVQDAKTGVLIEKKLAVRQGKGYVIADYRGGSRDRPDWR